MVDYLAILIRETIDAIRAFTGIESDADLLTGKTNASLGTGESSKTEFKLSNRSGYVKSPVGIVLVDDTHNDHAIKREPCVHLVMEHPYRLIGGKHFFRVDSIARATNVSVAHSSARNLNGCRCLLQ